MENTKAKQKNVKLYPTYKMFSWDMLFYYAIIYLFFTQVKGISAADVMLAESFYPIFKVLLLIPATILIDKIGKRRSLIIGNLFIALSTLTYIFATSYEMIVLGEFFSAVGYIIKGVCETNMLYDSLEKNEKRGMLFSKIDGRATSFYFYIDAFSSIVSGFLFAFNGYLPMIFCLITNLISIVMAMNFEEIDDAPSNEKITLRKEVKELKKSLKGIFKSPRLRNLLLFGAIFAGILSTLITLRSSILSDIEVPAQYFGIIFAILGIISGIAAKNQHKIHKRFRNKTLAILSLPVVISCVILGLWCVAGFDKELTIIVVLMVFLIQYIAKGPFNTLIRQYLNNFTNTTLRTKISSSYNLLESLFRSMFSLFASFLLRYTSTANTLTVVGCIATVGIVLLLDNMREKVGLKPEEYKEKDMKILELK